MNLIRCVIFASIVAKLGATKVGGGVRMGFVADTGIGNAHPGRQVWTDYYGVEHDERYRVNGELCLNAKGKSCMAPSMASEVFSMLRAVKTDVVVHVGDADYESSPKSWRNFLKEELSPEADYIMAKGNHDKDGWDGIDDLWSGPEGYRQTGIDMLKQRHLTCTGTYGESFACRNSDVMLYVSDVGVDAAGESNNREQAAALEAALAGAADAKWKICAWHMNQEATQVSYKGDATGWEVYEICRRHGAFIVNGHAHVYSRSFEVSQFARKRHSHHVEDIQVGNYFNHHQIALRQSNATAPNAGTTGIAVVGIGGARNEPQLIDRSFWAKIYSTTCLQPTCTQAKFPDAFGGLVCDFSSDAVAPCALITNRGLKLPDVFALIRSDGAGVPLASKDTADVVLAHFTKGLQDDLKEYGAEKAAEWASAATPNVAWWQGPGGEIFTGGSTVSVESSTVSNQEQSLQDSSSAPVEQYQIRELGENIMSGVRKLIVGGSGDSFSCDNKPVPDDQHSCEQQMQWGKCNDAFMLQNGGYCNIVCGRATSGCR